MPKPMRTLRPTQLNVAIPEDLRTVLDLKLFSTLEGRVPHGAYSKYICQTLQEALFPPQHCATEMATERFERIEKALRFARQQISGYAEDYAKDQDWSELIRILEGG